MKLIYLSLIFFGFPWLTSRAFSLTCPSDGYSIRVSLRQHSLWLCEWGSTSRVFSISLGWGGRGKHHEGDHKTPLGTYLLGNPRHSDNYAFFIPISYPTPLQRWLGFTGGAVGVHGPPRRGNSFDADAATEDWTEGCLALASDRAITEVVAWVNRNSPAFIHID